KFSAFHDETGRLNVDGMNIISNDGSNKLNRSRKARVSYKVQRTINASLVTQFCRKLAAERPLKDIRDEYNYPKKKGIKDECSRLLEASTMKSRRGFAIQRLMNAMRQAHA